MTLASGARAEFSQMDEPSLRSECCMRFSNRDLDAEFRLSALRIPQEWSAS